MLKVLSNILCDLDPKVKVIGQKAGICDGVPSTSALVLSMLMFNCSLNNVKAETNEKKYTLFSAILFLMCPSDNYSVIRSLQKGMSKHCGPRSDYPYRAFPWFLKISA